MIILIIELTSSSFMVMICCGMSIDPGRCEMEYQLKGPLIDLLNTMNFLEFEITIMFYSHPATNSKVCSWRGFLSWSVVACQDSGTG